MRMPVFLLFLLLSFAAHAKEQLPVIELNKDSTTFLLYDGWRYHEGDNKEWAEPSFNDSSWQVVNILMGRNNGNRLDFKGIGWFRLHINVDSSMIGEQMVLRMRQVGASEIYLDGKLIERYGKIGKDHKSSLYFNPQKKPLPLIFLTAGKHLIAIRYAKYNAQQSIDKYKDVYIGIQPALQDAKYAIDKYKGELLIYGAVFFPFFSLFLVLAFVHFVLWLYYRSDKANLFFSFFCISLCIAAAAIYLPATASNPQLLIWGPNVALISYLLIFLSLSGLSHNLFSKKKKWFYILCVFTFISVIITIIDPVFATNFVGIIMVALVIDSLIASGKAILIKSKGPKVVAIGILLFTLFLVFLVILSAIGVQPDLKDARTSEIFYGACILAMLSIPVSMSVYLARTFATTSKNLKKQLVQVQELSEQTMAQEQEKKRILENQKLKLEEEVKERTSEIVAEKQKSDDLLHNILPEEIASELKDRGATTAQMFDHVTVLFTDFVNFTIAGERMGSQALVEELHICFKAFDEIMDTYGIEKIKTIGDAYLAVCGLPSADKQHAEKVVNAAKDILAFMQNRRAELGDKTFEIRIGVHSGEVVAGIVGVKKFAYDIWGDTVNTASRMESKSEPGKINISETTYNLVKDKFTCTYRGELEAKNKGKLKMYFVEE